MRIFPHKKSGLRLPFPFHIQHMLDVVQRDLTLSGGEANEP